MCWFAEELSTSHFGDKRLSKRLVKMLQDLSKSPSSSVPEALQDPSAAIAAIVSGVLIESMIAKFFLPIERVLLQELKERSEC